MSTRKTIREEALTLFFGERLRRHECLANRGKGRDQDSVDLQALQGHGG